MAALPDASQRLESSVSRDLLSYGSLTYLAAYVERGVKGGAKGVSIVDCIRTVWIGRKKKEGGPEPYI